MITSLGFTGSSDFGMPTDEQVKYITQVFYLLGAMHVHHGDCVNSDAKFHEIAKFFKEHTGKPLIHVHPPSDPKKRAFCNGDIVYAEKPYLKRNRNIVNMVDVLLACPHGPEVLRSGTWSTIRYAKQKGIAIHIVYPDGKFEIVPSVTTVATQGNAL